MELAELRSPMWREVYHEKKQSDTVSVLLNALRAFQANGCGTVLSTVFCALKRVFAVSCVMEQEFVVFNPQLCVISLFVHECTLDATCSLSSSH